MKKRRIFEILSTAIFSLSLVALNHESKKIEKVDAADEWNIVSTRALANNSAFVVANNDSFTFIKLTENDYSSVAEDPGFSYCGGLTNYSLSDYNFKSKIFFSEDNINFTSYSEISNDANYFFHDGTFRLGFNDTKFTKKDCANFKFIKIEEGCEFPSFNYCNGTGSKTKYVQSETTTSIIIAKATSDATSGVQSYKEYSASGALPFSGIANDLWDNSFFDSTPGYRHTIFQFGTFNVDFFGSAPDPTERVTDAYDIARNLKFNGVPFYKIFKKYPNTQLDYAHGYNFLHIAYPEELTLATTNYLIPTIELNEITDFVDGKILPFKAQLISGHWQNTSYETFKVEKSVKVSSYLNDGITWPFSFYNNQPVCVATSMPASGADLAISINGGDNAGAACNFVFYNVTIVFNAGYEGSGIIQIIDKDVLGTYYGFIMENNTDYILEISAHENGDKFDFKLAINHILIYDGQVNVNSADLKFGGQIYSVNPSVTWTFKDVVEVPFYTPSIHFEGSSSYDFMEGDPVYNFAPLISVANLYETSPSIPTYHFTEGAVTNNKFNAGNWKLIIEVTIEGYGLISKEISINVHGSVSYATIKFGDSEPIEVVIGSKLTKPVNPTKESDNEHDYVFDGWYFEGAKWNFETDVVSGDMVFEARFKQTERHYNVVVNFVGFEKESQTYKLSAGSELPFEIFNEDFVSSFTVYQDGNEINSLIVNEDTTITVVYDVLFVYHPATEATCGQNGTVAYYTSSLYEGYYFADPSGRILINNIYTPMLDHTLLHMDAKEATCLRDGNIECYYCPNCGKHYYDEEGTRLMSENEWVIPKLEHDIIHHEYVEDTCSKDGYIEYYECRYEEGAYYLDESCTELVFNIVIPSTGHQYSDITYKWSTKGDKYICTASAKCVKCGDLIIEQKEAVATTTRESTCKKNGEICYFVTFENNIFNSQTKIVTIPKLEHNLSFVEEVKATTNSTGIKAHYFCEDCGTYFIKNGEDYVEVSLTSLTIPKLDNNEDDEKGCNGSIESSSLVLMITLGATIALLSLKKKEEK